MAVLPIFLFGCAFWWVSLDLTRNHSIFAVVSSCCFLSFVSSVIRSVSGVLPFLIFPVAVIVLLFVILFL